MKYYICPQCGDLKTDEQINDDCSTGGMGMCSCQYMQILWTGNEFEVVGAREFTPYEPIPEEVYTPLSIIANVLARLRAYKSWKRD